MQLHMSQTLKFVKTGNLQKFNPGKVEAYMVIMLLYMTLVHRYCVVVSMVCLSSMYTEHVYFLCGNEYSYHGGVNAPPGSNTNNPVVCCLTLFQFPEGWVL